MVNGGKWWYKISVSLNLGMDKVRQTTTGRPDSLDWLEIRKN